MPRCWAGASLHPSGHPGSSRPHQAAAALASGHRQGSWHGGIVCCGDKDQGKQTLATSVLNSVARSLVALLLYVVVKHSCMLLVECLSNSCLCADSGSQFVMTAEISLVTKSVLAGRVWCHCCELWRHRCTAKCASHSFV